MRLIDDFIWRSLSPKSRETLAASLRLKPVGPRGGSIEGYRRRKPPEAGLPAPAVPPRGPLPLQGGAEAPLKFGD